MENVCVNGTKLTHLVLLHAAEKHNRHAVTIIFLHAWLPQYYILVLGINEITWLCMYVNNLTLD